MVYINDMVYIDGLYQRYYKMLWGKYRKLLLNKYIQSFWVTNETIKLKTVKNGRSILPLTETIWRSCFQIMRF